MKHKPVKRFEIYSRKKERKTCPRCGDTFLAQHENRLYCGKCRYTQFLTK